MPIKMAIGDGSTFIFAENGTELFTVGTNIFGNLGLGDTQDRDQLTLVSLPLNTGEKILKLSSGWTGILCY